MPTTMKIADLLNGYHVDKSNIQSVGNMTIIPIVGDVEFTNVANHNDVKLTRDVGYNQLSFENASGNVGIVIQGFTVISKTQRAQDRTVPYAHLIKGHRGQVIPANCLQPHQGGLFNVNQLKDEEFMVLPPSLRGMGLKKSTIRNSETGALWETLRGWSRTSDSSSLVNFYSKFEDRLGQFIAQFEAVEHQLGAITLINGELVAIDIVPMYATWKALWRTLIRDSYGAESIRISENVGPVIDTPNVGSRETKTIDALADAYSNAKDIFVGNVEAKVGTVVGQDITCSCQETVEEISLFGLDSQGFKGQAVFHGSDHVVYMSLVTSSSERTNTGPRLRSLRTNPYGNSGFRFR